MRADSMAQVIVFPEKGCVKVTAIDAATVQSGEPEVLGVVFDWRTR